MSKTYKWKDEKGRVNETITETITICSGCGEELEDKPKEKFLLCKRCDKFSPRGARSYLDKTPVVDLNGVVKQKGLGKKNKEDRETKYKKMIQEGKTNSQISNMTGISLTYLYKLRKIVNGGKKK